tara:strand:- start:1631 stop:1873 length:243 start_codon:yes stop_codon:yes gene_type:complete
MKKKNNIDKKLLKILDKSLKKYNKKANSKMFDIPLYEKGLIDSFDFINIISDIEKEFKVKISINKIDAKTTINNLKNEFR